MLDDAEFFVTNVIKGPVRRGQTAPGVIDDRFWSFFVDPRVGTDDTSAQSLARQAELFRLPAAEGSDASLLAWRKLAALEDRVLAAKSAALNRRLGGEHRLDRRWSGTATRATRMQR